MTSNEKATHGDEPTPNFFRAYLDKSRRLRGLVTGEEHTWVEALLASEDLDDAANRGDVAAARTAVAVIARRLWPDKRKIPDSGVRQLVGVLGVAVRW